MQVNLVDPFTIRSSSIGVICFSLWTVLLALHISTQILTSPECISITRIGLTHGAGPDTFSIMSIFPSLSCPFLYLCVPGMGCVGVPDILVALFHQYVISQAFCLHSQSHFRIAWGNFWTTLSAVNSAMLFATLTMSNLQAVP